jgi:DNA-binding MarR family transcriptional regulator
MVALFAIRATGSCRMSELAEVTQQSAGALTGIVDRLIEEQLAIRLHDLNDRRVVQVMLTPHGQERLARIEQARYQTMEHILRQLPCDQLTHLEALLRVLLYRIKELCNNQELIFDQRNHHPGGVASEALYKKT